MIQTIYITISDASSLQFRGLGAVYVWHHQPYLVVDVNEKQEDYFAEETPIRDSLKGVIFVPNHKLGYVYREGNDPLGGFGHKLINQGSGKEIPQFIVDLENEYKIKFNHEVFGSGQKSSYQKNTVGNIFGYENEISTKIWDMVYEYFDNKELREWDKAIDKPWWLFCRKLEIETKLV